MKEGRYALPVSVCLSNITQKVMNGLSWNLCGCGQRNNPIDFGDDPDKEFLKDSLFTIAIPTDSQE